MEKGYQSSRMPASSPPVSTASTGGSSQTASNGSASASSSGSANSAVGVTGNGGLANNAGNGAPNGNSTSLAEQLSKTNLYIRGLTPTTTDKDLYALCSPYGTIISTKAILDKNTNKCKGLCHLDS
ncbi:unnamed protein product [Oppiella nova]|uniref:RRM domain-containing protein n=1 Tax=Oppiella nova TaxID=334625 RepID=A0A7R9MCV2_9ACAR|nr:unnamed protein product [Oppiella nova]CAG2174901.1 unnamed protein product [Oppiella nova]